MEQGFQVGEWQVQSDVGTLTRGEEQVQLEPKVMEVLLYLAEHAGEVLSKERLIQAVWPDTFVTDDVLTHAISELRRAFGDDAKDSHTIRTLPRRGYQLIAEVEFPEEEEPVTNPDRYRLERKLGEGGMGEVYLALDRSLNRRVALKFLRAEREAAPLWHRRLRREAKAAAALDHPYICKVFETGTLDGRCYIAMEYVSGDKLSERLKRGRIPVKEALHIALEMAEALEEAHRHGIVHRDIKASNVILSEQGHVKITDFGIARRFQKDLTDETDWTLTELSEAVSGTPESMSPEQIRADPVDQRSDIFSFGILLYEMLTGVHPFRKARQAETTAAILLTEATPLGRYLTDCPEILEHTVSKMLAKNPNQRYQSAHEIRTELSEPLARVATDSVRIAVPHKKKTSWLPACLGVVGLILAVLLGYAGWNLLRQRSPALEQDRKSIAVLPFDNLSPNPDDEYFSDGITEDIAAELAKIGDLRVMGRTSAFRFKGSDKSLGEIAGELGVATLLGGSVRRADETVRIVAQLIDGTTEEHLWAETYDRQLEDIFAIQSDVAKQIAASLEVELSSEEKRQIEKKFTEDAEAYNLYLLGRHYRKLETLASLPKAVTYYRQAIELDSEFALAYAGLAECYAVPLFYGRHKNALDLSEQAAAQALELDPSIALTHIAKGHVAQLRGDATTAAAEYARAVGLEPQNADAHREYALLLFRMGRLEDSLPELKEAHALDPLDWVANHYLTYWYTVTGEFDEAFQYARKALEVYPDGYPHENLGEIYSILGIYRKAEQHLKQALEIFPEWYTAQSTLARLYLKSGQLDEAVALSRRALSGRPNHTGLNLIAARVNLWKGDYAKAVEQYEKAYQMWPRHAGRIDRDGMARDRAEWGFALWKLGRHEEAQRRFTESIRLCEEDLGAGDQTFFPPEIIATVHAIRGEKEEAYRRLEEAIEAGWRDYALLSRDPMWADFQGEDRFRQMMAAVRAKVEEMRKRVEEMENQGER